MKACTDSDTAHLSSQLELMRSIRVDELVLFHAVVDAGNFSRAAKALNMTVPTASKNIRRLEERLGEPLFERSTRRVALTEFGHQFFAHSKRVLAEIANTHHFLQHHKSAPEGVLTIGLPHWMLRLFASEFIQEFGKTYPGIRFSIYDILASRLNENVDIDVYLHVFEPPSKKWTGKVLMPLKTNFYASAEYLAASPPLTHPLQLSSHPGIWIRNPYFSEQAWPWTDEKGMRKWVPVNSYGVLDNFEIALEWASNGIGVVFCPEVLIETTEYKDKLVRLFDGKYGSCFELKAYYKSQKLIPPKIEVFIEELSRYLAKHYCQ
ncbi:LysR substrate binding domain-containing protein [Ferrimonas sediminum]|uniref:LysR substrate binding domain-containing protein n=1 Tax=Ferrimonas sediminum TaxID=718193 RepID=A0A1G8JKS6_9GAMM|nr:LysR family transcriptional regulator [Ferrimonas sediminum]SDI31795.1 LysR substrate binding domain-containing protein [Ferrimonas sediminum]